MKITKKSQVIHLSLPILLLPQARPRFVRRGNFTHTYSPKPQRAELIALLKAQGPEQPLTGPLGMTLIIEIPLPKSLQRKDKSKQPLYKATRPDWDNLAKSVCDAANGILYVDDGQLAKVSVDKWYTDGDPKVHIQIYQL